MKAMRIVAWILRFVRNLKLSKGSKLTGDLSLNELCEAKVKLLCVVQREVYWEEYCCLKSGQSVSSKSSIFTLSPFPDAVGLMRVQGRLQFSGLSFDNKHPIILPHSCFSW